MTELEISQTAMNDPRTLAASDTNLTHGCSADVRSALLVQRNAIGALTAAGRRCSNLDEMLQNRETATGDQLANLNRDIAIQVAELAALSIPKGHCGGEA